MGYIVEISESKVEHLADNIGKMLHYGGMAMHCVEEMRSGHGYLGERGYGRYGMREHEMPPHDGYGHMGERYGRIGERYPRMDERSPRENWADDPYMDERRGRSEMTGRYMHR